MPKTSKQKLETSKLLLCLLLGGLNIIAITSIVFAFISTDASPLIALIERYSALATIAVGFYYWKAKCENIQKYKKTDKIGEIGE